MLRNINDHNKDEKMFTFINLNFLKPLIVRWSYVIVLTIHIQEREKIKIKMNIDGAIWQSTWATAYGVTWKHQCPYVLSSSMIQLSTTIYLSTLFLLPIQILSFLIIDKDNFFKVNSENNLTKHVDFEANNQIMLVSTTSVTMLTNFNCQS